jgi:hypothetical protein
LSTDEKKRHLLLYAIFPETEVCLGQVGNVAAIPVGDADRQSHECRLNTDHIAGLDFFRALSRFRILSTWLAIGIVGAA